MSILSRFSRLIIGLTGLLVLATPAQADPPQIGRDSKGLKPGYGVVQISLRSQTHVPGKLTLWFVRDGEDPKYFRNRITFTRNLGLFRSQPTLPLVKLYSMKPGRYRLIAHVSNCRDFPEPNMVCFFMGSPYPTARYDGQPAPLIVVEPDKLTDAGEFILEFPYNENLMPVTSWDQVSEQHTSMQIRWRPIDPEYSLRGRLPDLPLVENEPVHDLFKSSVTCKRPPEGDNWLPFHC